MAKQEVEHGLESKGERCENRQAGNVDTGLCLVRGKAMIGVVDFRESTVSMDVGCK